jgi:hypothetical protein
MQTNTQPERRSLKRFDLKLPIRISALENDQSKQVLVGASIRDISGNGAFVNSIQSVSEGHRVTLDLTLPIEGLDTLSADRLKVNLAGEVVRTEQSGFAVRFCETYQILI